MSRDILVALLVTVVLGDVVEVVSPDNGGLVHLGGVAVPVKILTTTD
jgi:hypothetical protein